MPQLQQSVTIIEYYMGVGTGGLKPPRFVDLHQAFKSQKTIITGIFIGWSSLLIILLLINRELIYFIISCGLASFVNLLSLFTLVDLIKEERNTLTDKEIYLLQKLAKKK